jgi:histone deacetylase 6
MDLDPRSDTLMHDGDGDIVTSTEFTQITAGPSSFSSVTGLPVANGTFSGTKSATPALKGAGLRRDGDVFDHDLTQLKDAPRPPKFKALPYASAQTGLVYDVRMRFHVEAIPTEDDVHPEDPRRIHAIFEAFVQAGLAWRESTSGPLTDYYMGRIDARMVTEDEVLLVHTKAHWDWVQTLSGKNADQLVDYLQHPLEQSRMDSVYLSPSTPYCAALSAGGAIEACRATLLGKVKNVFAIIRPPGHHAEREDAKGFCFYDNVSIATKVCQREFKAACRKVLILDWDVHHGNGIQQANYNDPNVLYISLHVHEKGHFYPELSYRDKRGPYGDHLHCGEGPGLGKNVNIPWSKKGMGDADYIYAFQQVVMPIATEFDPDLVIIAAGFDAAEGDMLGGCKVTPAGYAHMTHMLMSLAGGKLAVCLEGGYNLDSIARSATAVTRTLMGQPPDRLEQTNPSISGVNDIKEVLRQQSKFWANLYPKDMSARLAGPLQGERMHDVVRRWQATTLWDDHQMSPLFVHRESLSKSFENQVLATYDFMNSFAIHELTYLPDRTTWTKDRSSSSCTILLRSWPRRILAPARSSCITHGW